MIASDSFNIFQLFPCRFSIAFGTFHFLTFSCAGPSSSHKHHRFVHFRLVLVYRHAGQSMRQGELNSSTGVKCCKVQPPISCLSSLILPIVYLGFLQGASYKIYRSLPSGRLSCHDWSCPIIRHTCMPVVARTLKCSLAHMLQAETPKCAN